MTDSSTSSEQPDEIDAWVASVEQRFADIIEQIAALSGVMQDIGTDDDPDDHAKQLKTAFRMRGRRV